MKTTLTRKALLTGAAGAAVAATAGEALAQGDGPAIRASLYEGELPLNRPLDDAWRRAAPVTVPVFAQQVTTPVLQTAGLTSIAVRALYSPAELGFLLEWTDAVDDTPESLARFQDAVAVQLPARAGGEPPPFTMGGPGQPVHILQWRSSWQADIERAGGYVERVGAIHPRVIRDLPPGEILPEDVAALWSPGLAVDNPLSVAQPETTVDELVAEGFGSATSLPRSRGRGWGARRRGSLVVAVGLPLERGTAGETIAPGSVWPVAFAVWVGSLDNRGGRKHWANWTSCELVP